MAELSTGLVIEDDVSRPKERGAIRGDIHIKVYRNGQLINTIDDHNLVVDAGRRRLAELVTGQSQSIITHIGIGSGSNAESGSDTMLQEQLLFPLRPTRDSDGLTTKVNGLDAIFYFHIRNDEAVGLSIRELGLFCGDEVMFTHRVRRGEIFKEDDVEISITYVLHF